MRFLHVRSVRLQADRREVRLKPDTAEPSDEESLTRNARLLEQMQLGRAEHTKQPDTRSDERSPKYRKRHRFDE